ncbi:DUF4331 domain-containing protein [Glaciimonas immobilis]|uniref:DUF4331 domain-containing protein n=1 Tax=Glaciimonas immobilis TaxID=728004 RepID=A0A840S061_9BURK|nr:DUF4331 domain-containing protein [Glaciimonas immobilis]KAF3998461.1 DUF4331 domain-containing protein [Glaciimonas immobilis]MBB5202040.1 hypothetical protein [Glaciimonas immobilis]
MQAFLSKKVATVAIGAAISAIICLPAAASSHREAPFISGQPKVDGTDFYMFRSYEPGRQDYVTLVANYIPFQDPQGGPNFYQFDANALYEISVVNDGGSKENITFRFKFTNTSKRTALTVGGQPTLIPLINSGVISGVNPAALNVRETYTVDIVRGDRRVGTVSSVTNAANGAKVFDKPVDNIGDKSFGSATGYTTYANQHIYNVAIPGCGNGRVFVGQRQESFYIAVGKIFDLFNLNPLGPETGTPNSLAGKNISSLAMEVPVSCLTNGTEPVIGGFTTASVRQGRLINPNPASGNNNAVKEGGPWAQVSRLGMPLVNEVVIGLEDKDRFNASRPGADKQFAGYVTNPSLPALIQTLFPSALAPTNFPRTDLVAAFLTGIKGVNQPANVKASEMLRLNTAIAPTPRATQNALGVAGGDNAGFPNGRRPGDDVVDLSVRVAMGALCVLTGATDTLGVGCKPSDAAAGGLAFTDGVRNDATTFQPAFPYLNTPLPGSN